jgi:hypothetical protein
MRVETYYNLHRKCLSYRESGGRVYHARTLVLNNVTLAVQPAGRERVRREGKKNVHAFVRGEIGYIRYLDDADDGDITTNNMERQGYRRITYNPYKFDSFVYADTHEPVTSARQVVVMDRNIWEVAA